MRAAGWSVRSSASSTQINSAVLTDPQKPYSYDDFLQAAQDLSQVRTGPPLFVKAAIVTSDKRVKRNLSRTHFSWQAVILERIVAFDGSRFKLFGPMIGSGILCRTGFKCRR